jgi:hypothetical protein
MIHRTARVHTDKERVVFCRIPRRGIPKSLRDRFPASVKMLVSEMVQGTV